MSAGGVCPGGCLNGGCLSRGWGVCLGSVHLGMSAKRGCLPRECLLQQAMGKTIPLNRITDSCKNITLPETLFAGGDKTVN